MLFLSYQALGKVGAWGIEEVHASSWCLLEAITAVKFKMELHMLSLIFTKFDIPWMQA